MVELAGGVVCIFFPHRVRTKVSFSAALGTRERSSVAAVVSWKHHNDKVSEVLMLMG